MSTPMLDQKQREAIVDILILAMCIDGHFSLSEEAKFQEKLEALGSESGWISSYHLTLPMAQARAISESTEKVRNFLESVAPLLREPAVSSYVLEKTEQVLGSDGFQPEEGAFLAQLRLLLR